MIKYTTLRIVLALVAHRRIQMVHVDVKSAFLNGQLQEELYIAPPEGFAMEGQEQKVMRLHKALVGLQQAARA